MYVCVCVTSCLDLQVLRYTPKEWVQIGFEKRHAQEMGRKRVQTVFGMEYEALLLVVAAS